MNKKAQTIIRKLRLLPLLALLLGLALAGCSNGDDGDSIQNIVWKWVSVTEQSSSNTTTVPNPENYTITFLDDGTFTGMADCNAISGSYSQENGFTITPGPSTMAFCGEASLDQQYLNLLSNVAAGGPDGSGGLALESAGGAESMEFQNGGVAPES